MSEFDSRRLRRVLLTIAVLAALSAGLAFSATSCGDTERKPNALAQKVTNRNQLIGGPNALGEVGDFLLQNDEVRLVVQDKGYNRGAGLFGGSLIDADLQRTNAEGNLYGGNGNDTFGELFPAFFLEAINPEQISVINDGSDGGAAIVEVAGRGGEFVTMLRYINQVMVNSYEPKKPSKIFQEAAQDELSLPNSDGRALARFRTRYILEPGARHVRIESTVTNDSFSTLEFPDQDVLEIVADFLKIDLGNFTVPTGHVLGFGGINDIFVPGIGYDLRWGLEEAYRREVSLPAFPGHLTKFVATSNPDGISYGFFSAPSESNNFVYRKDQEGDYYGGEAEPDDLLMLFYASGFGGVFSNQLPEKLAPTYCKEDQSAEEVCESEFGDCGEDESCKSAKSSCVNNYDKCLQQKEDGVASSYTFTNYFVIGDGDVSSVTDELYRVKEIDTTTVRGQAFDQMSGKPVGEDQTILFYRARQNSPAGCEVEGEGADQKTPTVFNQSFTNSDGYFKLQLPPGHYCYRARGGERPLSDYTYFEVTGEEVFLRPVLKSTAGIEARITNADGIPLPAKLTVVGTHEYREDLPKRHYLYDLEAGEHWRTSDMRPDEADDPDTRRYVEAVAYSSADGHVSKHVRPGTYKLYFSRGIEYDLVEKTVELKPGQIARVNVQLENVLDTDGYLSGDFHMHAAGSIDSGLDYDKRVISIAAEDVEVVASSDHNYVSDYLPYIRRNNLQPWLRSIVGVELTTFEFGHFNAFPLEYEVGSINRGSIPWQNIPPQQIFDELRSKGKFGPDETIIQVNHPRDSILGYFSQYEVDPFDMSVGLGFSGDQNSTTERLTAALSASNGPAFVRDCRPDGINCTGPATDDDEPRFETTFSWDFDAIEIFNGKRMELMRHYRIPYEEGEWPEETMQTLLANVCENKGCDSPLELVGERCCPDGKTKVDGDSEKLVCEDDTTLQQACQDEKGHGVEAEMQAILAERYPRNAILCTDGEIAYPGSLDDWYTMLNHSRSFVTNEPGATQQTEKVYQKITATGNSDSHHAGSPNLTEPGHPRNYVRVGHDNPENLDVRDFVDALQNHRNIVTNGPFAVLEVETDGKRGRVGDEIDTDSNEVQLKVSVQAADWVGADRFRIIANGEPIDFDAAGDDGWVEFSLNKEGKYNRALSYEMDKDTWFVLEVRGDNNLFPVYPPTEIPRIPFDDIIGQIAGSFGFGGDIEGLAPNEVFPMTPFAFTNPIWVVSDGDGEFTPPNPPEGECKNGVFDPAGLVSREDLNKSLDIDSRMTGVDVPLNRHDHSKAPLKRPRGEYRDVRTLFRAFGHSH